MSESQHLALDVDSFDLKGAYGEDTWGSPKSIETDEAIRGWVVGLKEDGGAGYAVQNYLPRVCLTVLSP